MTVRVQLVAPGLTPGARRGVIGADEPLDERGRAAAAHLAGAWPPGVVSTCAPSAQCRETAALAGLAARPDVAVRDWDLGSWTGVSLAELAAWAAGPAGSTGLAESAGAAALARWSSDPDFDGHGGESLRRLRLRASDWLDSLAGGSPADERPSGERSTEEVPTEERPAEERPAEERPTEERPAEERPAEEQPDGPNHEQNGRLVTVTHAPFIRAALLCVLDAPIDVFWRLDVEPLASVHLTLRPERRAVRWSAGRPSR